MGRKKLTIEKTRYTIYSTEDNIKKVRKYASELHKEKIKKTHYE